MRQEWGCWNSIFTGHFNDWELEEAKRLLAWIWEEKGLEGSEDSAW